MRQVVLSVPIQPKRIRAAKLRLLWAMLVLPKSEPIVIRGCLEPAAISPPGKTLLEYFSGREPATSAHARTVGLVIYMVEPFNGYWETKRYAASTVRTRRPLNHRSGRILFRTEAEAWTCCDLWYDCDRLHSTFADFLEAIQEPPLHALPLKKEDSIEPIPMLTQADVEEAEYARIEFEGREQPALYNLGLELGWETVLSIQDRRLQAAQVLDKVRKTGAVPGNLPRTDSDFIRELNRCVRCYNYRQQVSHRVAEEEACKDLMKHWTTLGFIFLSKSELASLINRKHDTHYTAAGIAATCRRSGLKARRPLSSLEKLSGRHLDDALRHVLQPYEPSGSYFS